MTSINFNASATTALRTLQQTNSALETSQNRVSTGLKIGEAKDNAAYWSISTTLKSDNKALSTVKDALALGSATVDTAYQGLNQTLEVLNEITSKLTAATNANVDKKAVQAEISQLQNQLKSIATASSFGGENWLQTKVGTVDAKSIIAGFTRNEDRTVTLSDIAIDIGDGILIDDRAGADGILEGAAASLTSGDSFQIAGLIANAGTEIAYGAGERTIGMRDVITFSVTPDGQGAVAKVVTIDQKLVNDTLKVTDGKVRTNAEFVLVFNKALSDAGLAGITGSNDTATNIISLSSGTFSAAGAANTRAGVLEVSIENASLATIQEAIGTLTLATQKVTDAAANLGAVAKRIDTQQSFVSNLMDTIDEGVSNLIDADLSEESTRLQALQTKQQLGIQALSIANTSTQNILSLFRS